MSGADGSFEIDPRQFLPPESELDDDRDAADRAEGAHGVASLERIEDELNDVEAALTRLDAGDYGTCQSCGAQITESSLAADPLQRFCGQHGAPARAE